jgi:hypothetical protein
MPTMPTISLARQQYAGQPMLLIRRHVPRAELHAMATRRMTRVVAGRDFESPPMLLIYQEQSSLANIHSSNRTNRFLR